MAKAKQEEKKIFLLNVHLKGFKSIEDLKIDLKRGLNILIGKNASGKSNFLECLGQFNSLSTLQSSFKYSRIEYISSDNDSFIWEKEKDMQLKNSLPEEKIIFNEKLFINGDKKFDTLSRNLKPFTFKNKKIDNFSSPASILLRIGFNTYSLNIKYNLPTDSLECLNIPGTLKIMIEDGKFSGWSYPKTLSFLFGIFFKFVLDIDFDNDISIEKNSFIEQFKIKEKVKENLKKFTPIQDVKFNENINIYHTEKAITIENIKIDFKVNNNWIPWSQLSDGTKRLFYLIGEITDRESGLILVEEPELGIHPHQFHLVMQFLKEQAEDKQIIISTHSPQALNYLDEDELSHILVTYYDQKKGTQIKHLTKQQMNKAKKYMDEVGSLSDYWMLSDLE